MRPLIDRVHGLTWAELGELVEEDSWGVGDLSLCVGDVCLLLCLYVSVCFCMFLCVSVCHCVCCVSVGVTVCAVCLWVSLCAWEFVGVFLIEGQARSYAHWILTDLLRSSSRGHTALRVPARFEPGLPTWVFHLVSTLVDATCRFLVDATCPP